MMGLARNIRLVLSYDGSGFSGWQVQPGFRTIQDTIEDALETILKEKIKIHAAGRTDAGVHAFGQVATFITDSVIPADALLRAINSLLPADVAVTAVQDVGLNFHPRYSAKSKTYIYAASMSPVKNPLFSRYALHIKQNLDIEAMENAAQFFLGEHDFASFMGVGTPVKSTVRNVMESGLFLRNDMLYYAIKGNGFLRHMVRNIVGTLLEVGKKKIDPSDINRIIDAKNRAEAGPTAPPQGLYLVGVEY
jgi:tRNA pseudouridine38-40 synthase